MSVLLTVIRGWIWRRSSPTLTSPNMTPNYSRIGVTTVPTHPHQLPRVIASHTTHNQETPSPDYEQHTNPPPYFFNYIFSSPGRLSLSLCKNLIAHIKTKTLSLITYKMQTMYPTIPYKAQEMMRSTMSYVKTWFFFSDFAFNDMDPKIF